MVPRLRHNIAALGTLQAANYLVPLITLPFLARILGVEVFGKVAFVQVLMTAFIVVSDYGFSWSATLRIASHRTNRELVTSIFTSTWAAQWMVLGACLIAIGLLVATIPLLRADAPLHLMGVLLVIGNVLFPLWLLQGLERMREVAIIQIAGRLAAVPWMFIFIRGPNDGLLAVALIGLGPILAGLTSIWWIRRYKVVDFRRAALSDILSVLRSGGGLFVSKLTISSYTTLVPLVLGAVSGPAALACFNLADRVRNASQSSLTPLTQAIFPRMGHLFSNDEKAARTLLKLSILSVLVVGGCASAVLWLFAVPITTLIGGSAYQSSAGVLRYLAPLPLVISISQVAALQVLLPNNRQRQFNHALRSGSVLALLLMWPMCFLFRENGAALVWLVVELLVCGYMWFVALGVLRARRSCEGSQAIVLPIEKVSR
ncbi:MAG TPA: oligosaccharide flippase family protein [Steroidobacteraceae bacterium]|jgi:PST family polysaccharide transporter